MFDDKTEPQLVPKLLLRVSVRELHNILVIDPNDHVIKDDRDEDDNIVISNSKLRSLLPPQLKQMSASYKFMGGFNVSFMIKVCIHRCYPVVIGI